MTQLTTAAAPAVPPASPETAGEDAVRPFRARLPDADVADLRRRLGRPVVLGVRTGSGRSPRGQRGSSGGLGSRRLHDVPQRDLGCPAQLG
jgi:hypothetical protein